MAFFEEQKLPSSTAVLMLIVSLLVEGAQLGLTLIPIVGEIAAPVISVGSFFMFWVWFQMYGISYSKPSRLIPEMCAAIIGVTPVIDGALPETVLSVAWVIATNRSNFVKSVESLAKGNVSQAFSQGSRAVAGFTLGPVTEAALNRRAEKAEASKKAVKNNEQNFDYDPEKVQPAQATARPVVQDIRPPQKTDPRKRDEDSSYVRRKDYKIAA